MSEQNSLDLAVEYKINCVLFNTNNSLLSKKFRSRVWISRRLGSCWNFPFFITSVVAPSLQFRNNNNKESESKIIGLETLAYADRRREAKASVHRRFVLCV